MPVNIRNAELVLNPDRRFQPRHKGVCGYVEVYAVAPGCLPECVGSLYTSLYRGEVRFNIGARVPVRLPEALEHVRSTIRGNYDLKPMSPEMLAVLTRTEEQVAA